MKQCFIPVRIAPVTIQVLQCEETNLAKPAVVCVVLVETWHLDEQVALRGFGRVGKT